MRACDLFQKNIERCKALLELHRVVIPRGRQVVHGEAADILRATIVLAVAALDFYFHKRIVEVTILNKQSISRRAVVR